MDVEQRKRLAFLCFLWDTQHAVLFSQSLCMSAFELRTALPCSPATWEAESAEEWRQNSRRETPLKFFLPVLKSYISPSTSNQRNHLNALSQLLILQGLLSIFWDMNRREQTSIGCDNLLGSDEWRLRLGTSYDVWKADFDTYCLNLSSSFDSVSYAHNPNIRSDMQRFVTSTLAIYHAAHIILNVDILDLQIYAGAKHIVGRPVSTVDYEKSRRAAIDWAQKRPGTSSASTASWHAACLLRDSILNLHDSNVHDAFHYPWCLYLATVTCWAVHHSRDDHRTGSESQRTSPDTRGEDAAGIYGADETFWDAKAEMNALVSGMTSSGPEGLWRSDRKYSTKGLTAVMAQYLSSVRWAAVHEGIKVLGGL